MVRPSLIGSLLPLNQNVVLTVDRNKTRVYSTDLIDLFMDGEYDNCEITSIKVEKYGWFSLDLATYE